MRSILTTFLFSALCVVQYVQAETASRIVKWKDENGIIHYGDKIPPQYANRENFLMNRQGITIQKNNPNIQQDKATELVKQEQEKKDRALLGTFTNADEIDLARDRNLEPDLLALRNLQQDRTVAQKKLDASNAMAESFTKTKKTVPAPVSAELKTHQTAVAKINQRISERQQAIDNIRKRFAEDKKRYLNLRGQSAENPAPASVPNK